MFLQQKIIAVLLSVCLFAFIFDLVRRKKLRAEYSWLWFLTALSILLVSINYHLLTFLSKTIGVVDPTAALFFLALAYLFFIAIHFSVKISLLTEQVKDLVQENSILKAENETRR